MIRVSDAPVVPESHRASATMLLRYEDVAQDGRITLEALPHGIGESVWAKLLRDHPIAKDARSLGVLPILTRLVVEANEDPISVLRPLQGHGLYELAHTKKDGVVDRIMLNLWLDVRGTIGRTQGSVPRDGEPIVVGRVFAEHVFTRPFAEPGQRKVLRLEFPGAPEIPETVYAWRDPADLLALPEDAEPFEGALEEDPVPVVFGLGHTDGNQHVNSLVYPRLFEEAVLRRLQSLGRSPVVLPRALDVAYRKPSFAGERVRLSLRTFGCGGKSGDVGAVGMFTGEGPGARPHCYLRMRFAT